MYQHQKRHLRKQPLPKRVLFYTLSGMILIFFASLLESGFGSFLPVKLFTVFERITLGRLLLYTLLTTLRVFAAYAVALSLTLFTIFLFLKHKKLENFSMPIFDILQSVPVLAFFPLIIISFVRLDLPELAAQTVLVVAMFWSVLFDAISGVHQIPQDILDAARIYNANEAQLFKKVILPAIFPSMVTGSIISFGAGWNVIIISEYINYGSTRIRLPGLGNVLSSSAGNDNAIFITALLCLVAVILLLDHFIWRPLADYSEKFKFE